MDSAKVSVSEHILDLLRQINMNARHIMTKEIDFSSLTIHQLHILKAIRKKCKVNLTSLCSELNLSKGCMSLTINKLVEEGYVLRKENLSDRRNIEIMLSEKGEKILDETVQKSRQIFNLLTSSLREDELAEIRENLIKLNNSIGDAINRKHEAEKE